MNNTPHSDVRRGIPVAPSLREIEQPDIATPPLSVYKRIFFLSIQAVFNAIIIGFIAKLLVWLISLITNLAFYGTFSFEEASPAGHGLGMLVIAVPIVGALIVGIMARFGSPAIRGHGIPEAMEQVLTNDSKIKPIITFLKPLSAAISIGTGGPFGAEGPIIATGGAFGSVTGQIMRITASERKTMLAAGATAGMAAIFGTPVAGVLLAIELLLFEFSARSIIPVALACATGAAMHFALFGTSPVFPMAAIAEPTSLAMVCYVLMGAVLGVAASFVSKGVYLIEDMFEHLPIHWMWWPAIGAVAVGVVGYFAPHTLGVGYDNISMLLSGDMPIKFLLSMCFLKLISWSLSLGSGTSGGTLAPLLTIGGATGSLLGLLVITVFPQSQINIATCALIGMAAMFAGASRALLTSIVFALETTMQPHGLLPLLGACTASYFVSFFLMKGSIMTEKIQRRGIYTPDSFEPDVLQRLNVDAVMNESFEALSPANTIKDAREWIKDKAAHQGQNTAFVIADENAQLLGVVKREDIFNKNYADDLRVTEAITQDTIFIYPEHRLGFAVDLLDKHDTDLLPVLEHKNKKLVGVITHREIFKAYTLRRKETEFFQREISLKRRAFTIVLKGKNFLADGFKKDS